jgi:hypothetical protein
LRSADLGARLRSLAPLVVCSLILVSPSRANADGLTWRWNRDAIGCELDQQLGSASTKISISRNPGTDETLIDFKVRSPNFWRGYYPDGTVALSSGLVFPARVQVYSAQNRSYQLAATITDPNFIKALVDVSTVSIAHKEFGHFDVPVKDMSAAIEALHNCEGTYLKLWGIDAAAVWALQARPVPVQPLQELFTTFDYPGTGLAGNMGADIIAKLEVGEDGAVRSCTWLGPKEHPQFGEAICKGLKERARFQAAHDASGRPVSAPYVTVAKFRIGGY